MRQDLRIIFAAKNVLVNSQRLIMQKSILIVLFVIKKLELFTANQKDKSINFIQKNAQVVLKITIIL